MANTFALLTEMEDMDEWQVLSHPNLCENFCVANCCASDPASCVHKFTTEKHARASVVERTPDLIPAKTRKRRRKYVALY